MSGSTIVSTEAQLDAAIQTADSLAAGTFTITLSGNITETSDSTAINLKNGVSLVVDGATHSLNGAGEYRGLFVYSGNVTINSLTITNAAAIGGAGGNSDNAAGGGGAGLGGGLFIGGPSHSPTVTLNQVYFSADKAVGGAGGASTGAQASYQAGQRVGFYAGGGGMGGAGGSYTNLTPSNADYSSGGGGGIGNTATGGTIMGSSTSGSAGIVLGANAGGPGASERKEGAGGLNGGGGGAAYLTQSAPGSYGSAEGGGAAGGGGGVGGQQGSTVASPGYGSTGGNGGFGGGGGGGYNAGGNGGFGGGGGGGGEQNLGGKGGWGGGGGNGGKTTSFSTGGFGGGHSYGATYGTGRGKFGGGGGGGLGAGGDVFVYQGASLIIGAGTLSGGSIQGGKGGTGQYYSGTNGQSLASGIFLYAGQVLNLSPGSGQSLTISDQIDDQLGVGNTLTSAGANVTVYGAILVDGAGTVVLSATNKITGATTIEAGGTLDLNASGAAGSGGIRFGASHGDLQIQGSAFTNDGTFSNSITNFVAGDAVDLVGLTFQSGATATVSGATLKVISNGVTDSLALSSSATSFLVLPDTDGGSDVIVNTFTITDMSDLTADLLAINAGGADAGAGAVYTFDFVSSFAIASTQSIDLDSGASVTFSGGFATSSGGYEVEAGTLIAGAMGAIGSGAITVDSGALLSLGNFGQTIGDLSGAGAITLGSGTLTEGTANSTTFSGGISGTGVLVKQGSGTLTLSGSNSFSGGIALNAGAIDLAAADAGGTGTITFGSGTGDILAFSSATAPANVISGLVIGQTLDVTGQTVTSASIVNSNTLQIDLSSGGPIDLTLNSGQSYGSDGFTTASDGNGGTEIIVGTAVTEAALIYGETIDQAGILATTESVSVAGVMTLENSGGTAVGTIVVGTSLSTGDFLLRSDGSGGTDVIEDTLFGTYTSSLILLVNPTTIASTAEITGSLASAVGVYGASGMLVYSSYITATPDSNNIPLFAAVAGVHGGSPAGQEFFVPSSMDLTSLSLTLSDPNPADGGSIMVYLVPNGGGSPQIPSSTGITLNGGTLLATILDSSLSTLPGIITLPIDVSASGNEWIELVGNSTTMGAAWWRTADTIGYDLGNTYDSVSNTDAGLYNNHVSGVAPDKGTGFASSDGGSFEMQISTPGTLITPVNLVNLGTVSETGLSSVGVTLASGGTISNAASAVIAGYNAGIIGTIDPVTVMNAGSIGGSGNLGYGIDLQAGGSITNLSGGTITGGYSGIYVANAAGTISNSGDIIGTSGAAVQLSTGSVANLSGGIITGVAEGVQIGVGGFVTNASGGSITGSRGVYSGTGPFTLVNAGYISGTGKYPADAGVFLSAGGSVTNQSSGTIIGDNEGVYASSGTVINAGTIESAVGTAGFAVYFSGALSRLIDDPGAVFNGRIYGGATDTAVLELASAASAGTIAGFGTFVTNFGSLVFDAGAQWTVAGNDSASGLGTLVMTGFTVGDTIDLTNFAASNKAFASNSLVLGNGVGDHETLDISGSFTTAQFQIGSDGNSGTDITLLASPVIAGTVAGQTTTDEATVQPFSAATITDANGSQSESVTITLTNADVATDADGTLSGSGLIKTGTGTYQLNASNAAALTTELQALVFTPTEHQVAPGDTVTTGFTIQETDLDGLTASDSTTTVIATAVNDPPTITLSSVAVGVPNEAGDTPFAAMTINDPDVGHTDTVTVTLSDPTGGTLSNLDGGSFDAITGVYSVSGTANAVTTALDGLQFTPAAPTSGYLRTTSFTVSVTGSGGNASNDAISVTAVQQVLGLATTSGGNDVISVSPDGTGFPAATGGKTNQAVVTDPSSSTTYTLPSGYQAEFLGGTAGATLTDPSVGSALLVGNSGDDLITTLADNDTILGGGGTDTLTATGDDEVILGGSGNNSISATGTGSITGGTGTNTITASGNVSVISNGVDDLVNLSSGAVSVLAALGSNGTRILSGFATVYAAIAGSNATLEGGTGALNVTTSGSNAFVIGDTGALTATDPGTHDTIFAGAASSATISASGNDGLLLGGTGNLVASLGGGTETSNTLVGGSGLNTLTAGGTSDLIAAGAGSTTVNAAGFDNVILGGSGSLAVNDSGDDDGNLIAAFGALAPSVTLGGSGALAWGGSNAFTVVATNLEDTVLGGTGLTTVTIAGSLSENSSNVVLGGSGGLTVDDQDGQADTIAAFGASSAGATLGGSKNIVFGGSGGALTALVGGSDNIVVGAGGSFATGVSLTAAASGAEVVGGTGALTVDDLGTGDVIGAFGAASASATLGGANAMLFGGSGDLTASVGGSDNIVVGAGGSFATSVTVAASATGAQVLGGTGILTVDDLGTGDVIGAFGASAAHVTLGGANGVMFGGSGSVTAVVGGSGNLLAGGSATNAVTVTGSSDTILAGSGPMTVAGSSSTGLVVAASASNLDFVGGSSGATILGSSGAMSINGGAGGETLFGAAGLDVEYLGSTAGLLFVAGSGSETLNAGGASSNNEMVGGTGADTIIGGTGNDTMVGGGGSASLVGSTGSSQDWFIFMQVNAGGADTIANFTDTDQAWFAGYGSGAAATAVAGATTVAGGTVISLTGGTTITFANLTVAEVATDYSQGRIFSSQALG